MNSTATRRPAAACPQVEVKITKESMIITVPLTQVQCFGDFNAGNIHVENLQTMNTHESLAIGE